MGDTRNDLKDEVQQALTNWERAMKALNEAKQALKAETEKLAASGNEKLTVTQMDRLADLGWDVGQCEDAVEMAHDILWDAATALANDLAARRSRA